MPNDGSITLGVNSREVDLKTRHSILRKSGVRVYVWPSAALMSEQLCKGSRNVSRQTAHAEEVA